MKAEMLKQLLAEEKIEYFCVLSIKEGKVINPRLLPEEAKNVIAFLIPYRTDREEKTPLAHFARIRDYHGFAKELFSKIVPKLKNIYPDNEFWGFADHSPLNERELAFKGGLGDIGKNGLLLNEKYGSYVFIGEIFTDAELSATVFPFKKLCSDCGKCIEICPKKDECISAISQKKRKTEEDLEVLKKENVVWGCDKCQEACPLNFNAELSPFEYFYKDKIKDLKDVFSMSDKEFESYSFSYRGRKTIEENISNILKKDID